MTFPPIPENFFTQVGDPHPFDAQEIREGVALIADPPDGPLGRVLDYGRFLLAANRVVNLTGAKDWDALVIPHLLDCVLSGTFIPADTRTIADWGSGGGMPGLVWASLHPKRRPHFWKKLRSNSTLRMFKFLWGKRRRSCRAKASLTSWWPERWSPWPSCWPAWMAEGWVWERSCGWPGRKLKMNGSEPGKNSETDGPLRPDIPIPLARPGTDRCGFFGVGLFSPEEGR